jgi:hypothetical protein
MARTAGVSAEEAVRRRYSQAARSPEADLCCPTAYDPRYLEMIPPEILDRDYGCGDPSQIVSACDTVLDLGAGAGKICYIAAQIAGSDEDVPAELKRDGELWSGCLAGAMREDRFMDAFGRAGFYGIALSKYDTQPWRTVRGIQFRSVTVTARKGKEGPCMERRQAVIYKGPWKEVRDDDGHVLRRGQRMAVCDKTYRILSQVPYAESIIPVPPLREVRLDKAQPFACKSATVRDPRETKGSRYRRMIAPKACNGEGCC